MAREKTSIYKSIYYNKNKDEKRINTDEMVSRIGSWKDYNKEYKVFKRKWFLYSYELCMYKEPKSCEGES